MPADHSDSHDTPGSVVKENRIDAVVPRRLHASWPAIICGVLAIPAVLWLLSLLGSAMGASVLDGTDAEALGDGFGIGAVTWMAVSGLVAFFIGGLVTGRLCGQDDDQAGLLHGVAVWSTATVLMLSLSYVGISGMVNTGSSIVATATEAASNAAGSLPDPSAMNSQRLNRVTTGISAAVKREIAEAASGTGGASLTEEEARQAINALDANALEQIGWSYINDDAAAARDTLAANTSLSEQQVNNLSNTIENKVETRVQEYKAEVEKAVETASSYAQAVLWAAFVTAALGLIAAIFGAMLGCHTAVRLHTVAVERSRVVAR
ncbi:hypothetical protein [uncultured Gimesia sp.]|uniref:hypothetical protein n=1 Tax=uncultured Gimesia sp. TaxID=1678688 RepID=UPI000E979421|nr:hypothetical protein [Planctomycetaceae bacterium]HBL42822.1 hypothetical protein [Planctomycetaceae bacterium]|tara:strand:+ start:1055 stop:2017 length:963 start_codon:yes stop_codon:yes gene_type:complete